jgi:photosystem II stability/assembly factor-like uncharacterized protein
MTRVLIALAACATAAATVFAQGPAPATPVMTANSTGSGPFDRLAFRGIGPATPSGRVDDVAVLESNPAIFYVAGATSGVWKTENMGTTFTPVFDNENTSSVGDIAIAATDPNLVWVGTGENNNRQSSSWGDGVYRSTDGGRSWKHMGLGSSRQIARIIVDPVDFNVVYVAALGDLWAAGGERGVYKTSDGGRTWNQILGVDEHTGATELVMDPNNNKVLYAATYQRRRQPWGMNGGGPGSAIWKTTDGGANWAKLENGIPAGPKGRIGMDIWRANPNVVYARIEHPTDSGVYRSDDGGASWRRLSTENPRPMYFSQIRVDPKTDSRVYMLGVSLHVSDDGGRTWRADGATNIHVDHHAMWINPANPDHIVLGNDGGVAISHDRSRTWVFMPNLMFAQAYHVSHDMQTPYHVCAGLQDNNTWCGPSAVRTNSGIINDDWYVISGGDGFQPLMDPTDHRVVYGESQDGRMSRIDRLTNERTSVRPEPAEGEPAYRWNWDTAMMLSPHDPRTIYVGANRLFRSSDRGHTWEAISPDLTTNPDRAAFSIMDVKDPDIRIARNDGVTTWGTLVTIAESPNRAGVLWTGSDDGVVSVSPEGGKGWTNVTPKVSGVPAKTYVSKVAPSRFDARTAYVTFDGHRGGDYGTYVFVTSDLGSSFRSIGGTLPKGEVARTITEDLKNPDVLYLGTETGLWVTLDRGKQWTRVKANLPTVPIYEIVLHPRENDMILATHGRGIWILDDLAPFQQWARSDSASPAFAFEPAPAIAFNAANDQMKGFEGDRRFLGPNPVPGATLTYRLRADAKDLKWTIRDAGNTVVRELSGNAVRDGLKAGLNSLAWDLRVQPLPPLRTQAPGPGGGGGGGGFGGGGNNGPFVLPGTYRATLTVDGKDANVVNVVVTGDRDIQLTDSNRKMWFDAAMTLHQMQRRANDLADTVNDAWTQFQALQQQTKNRALPDALKTRMDALTKELEAVRRKLGLAGGGGGGGGGGGFGGGNENVRGRIGQLKGALMGATALPTAVQTRQQQELQAALPKLESEAKNTAAKVAPLAKDMVNAGVLFGTP